MVKADSILIYGIALQSHSRMLLAGIHLPYKRDSLIVKMDARQKHSGMTTRKPNWNSL
jgi:hypothetical protein